MFRVGVVAMESVATTGGAFTFQHEVMSALANHAGGGEIEWVLITPPMPSTIQSISTSALIQTVELDLKTRDHRLGLAIQWFRSHVRSVISGNRFKGEAQRRSEYFTRKLEYLDLDMIWYLGPYPAAMEIPYMLTVWDIQHRIQPWFPEVSSDGIWDQREIVTTTQLQRAALITTGNSVGANQISTTYAIPRSRIVTNPLPVPNDALDFGVNPELFHQLNMAYSNFGDFVIYPAQFWAHKNHKVLLEAISHLMSTSNVVPKLVLTGSDKGNLSYINELIEKLDISTHVINLGFIERMDLLGLYSKAKALVFPSMFGPDNIPPLEAMAIGCPVLVADDPGMREQLGTAVVHLPPTDSKQWARAIASICEDSEVREHLIAEGKRVVLECTTNKYVDRVQDVILDFKRIRETWSRP